MSFTKADFLNYFVGGVIALTISSVLTGCRFGNHVSEPEPTPPGVNGFYRTEAQSLSLCAQTENSDCVAAPVNQIPKMVTDIFTNPVIFQTTSTEEAAIYNSSGTIGFPVFFDSAYNLGLSGSTSPQTLWYDANCKSHLYIAETGKLNRFNEFQSFGIYSISGRMDMTFEAEEAFEGTNCETELDAMHLCYENIANCPAGQADYDYVREKFELFVNNGIVTPATFKDLLSIYYAATYH